jgi:hypothetical protein
MSVPDQISASLAPKGDRGDSLLVTTGVTAGAGISVGTLVVFLSNKMGPNNTVGEVLQYLAPSISVFMSMLWYWLRRRVLQSLRYREIESCLKKARDTLYRAMEDPGASSEHINGMRKAIERLERIQIKILTNRGGDDVEY